MKYTEDNKIVFGNKTLLKSESLLRLYHFFNEYDKRVTEVQNY